MSNPSVTAPAEAWVDPADLHPNTYNPNTMDDFMFGKVIQSIATFGMTNPIIVRDLGGYYEIIDGEHRVRAAVELGLDRIPIWNLGTLTDPVAKQLTIVLNETHGEANRDKLGELLRDLLTSETTDSLLNILPYQQPELKALLNVPDFDWDQIEQLAERNGDHERSTWVERLYRMPPEAAEILDKAIAMVREEQEIPDWKAIEMICSDYLWKAQHGES